MNTNETIAPQFTIGEADQQSAFLTNPEGWDIATLSRIDVSRMNEPERAGHSVTDDEWQSIVNLVNAAPDLLAALQNICNNSFYGDSTGYQHVNVDSITNALAAIDQATRPA